MNLGSVIWLEESKKASIYERTIEDLNLESVYHKILSVDNVLDSLCLDIETIEFRQEILIDLMEIPGLLDELMSALMAFNDLKPFYHKDFYVKTNMYRIIDVLIIVEETIKSLKLLHGVLGYYQFNSKGLKDLATKVKEQIESKAFRQMEQDLNAIKYLFRSIRGVTLSVNLTSGMRPLYAQVTEISDHKFRFPKAFRKISDYFNNDRHFLGESLSSYVPVFKVKGLDYDILEEIEYSLRNHKGQLEKFLTAYDKMDIQPFVNLYHEFEFFESSCSLFSTLKSKGLPLSIPKFVQKNGVLKICEGYNTHLGLKESLEAKDIVLNSFDMNQKRLGFILTGANRGGKTTFTQMLGQIRVLAQLGLYVPCKSCTLSVVEGIYTHFPRMEEESVDLGRFGMECQRFVEIFKVMRANSFLLMNETFAGTSHLESLYVAGQGIKALLKYQYPFVYNTHLHQLFNEMTKDKKEYPLVSLVTDADIDSVSFKIKESLPIGKSYAKRIATKYGVTYEQLLTEMESDQ